MASTGFVQDAASLQVPHRSYPSGILATFETHLLFAAESVYAVM